MNGYDQLFFDRVAVQSLSTARVMVRWLREWIAPTSVADFGCGQGLCLAAWHEAGLDDVLGLDGAALDAGRLHIPPDRFVQADLCQPVHLHRPFDLVQCLEVAEHLPESAAAGLVESLVRHAPVVLFSAALPGQGGWRHVNEQTPAYWRELFAQHSFQMFDCMRPKLLVDEQVRWFSAQNTFLFVHQSRVEALSVTVRSTALDAPHPIPDSSPMWWKAARMLVSCWPVPVVSAVDRLLQHVNLLRRKLSSAPPTLVLPLPLPQPLRVESVRSDR